MTTEQIIKGLEESVIRIEAFYDGMNIPQELRSSENKKALALIKELLAENTGLKTALETLRDVAKDYEHHNENLKKENKYLRERLAEEMEHKEDMVVSELKAEIEILSKENETLKITTIDQYSHLCDCHDKIAEMLRQKEADTVKKMQERLKELAFPESECGWDCVYIRQVDGVAKEILEGNHEVQE